jgi:hypothetical protein
LVPGFLVYRDHIVTKIVRSLEVGVPDGILTRDVADTIRPEVNPLGRREPENDL